MIKPSKNKITQEYSRVKHPAIDFSGNMPRIVRACDDLEIIESVDGYAKNWKPNSDNDPFKDDPRRPRLITEDYGNYCIGRHSDGRKSLYAHLQNGTPPPLGKKYRKGELMSSRIGNTGNSTGKHLHFELRNKQNVRIKPMFEEDQMFTQKQYDTCISDRNKFWKERDVAVKKAKTLAEQLHECQNNSGGGDVDTGGLFDSIKSLLTMDIKITNFEEAEEAINHIKEELSGYREMVEEKETTSPETEALKETLRWAVLGTISFLATMGISVLTDLPPEYSTRTTVIITVVLRGVDKYMHEYGKKNDIAALISGLTRF